jgi:prepilin-type N-terminal cleavage/methylation domain-containing protein
LSHRRPAFTLLEMMLAMVIALIMLVALYAAMDAQLRTMDEGRDKVEKSTVSRALFNRISADMAPSVSPVAPPISSSSSSGSTGTGTTTDMSSTTPTSSSTTVVNFQIGVKGDNSQVSIYQTRLTRKTIAPPDDGSGNQNPYASDIRRICYFMSSDADRKGLARQEIRLATSELVDDVPQSVDEFTKIIAKEVESFELRYFDGTNWNDSWDGSTPGPDGKTPQGPPRCIEITIGIRLGADDELKTFKHVIAFGAAPGTPATDSTGGTP